MKDAVLIAGPTASGKSAAALLLADKLDGVIINADAMQVYKDLLITSARPTIEQQQGVSHLLYGYLDGAVRCSAGVWARDAETEIAKARAANKTPIIVGGTGLYFRALLDGLSPIPDIAADIRQQAISRHGDIGAEAFKTEVVNNDPAMARLAVGDTQRLIRAWEVFTATGQPLSHFQNLPRQALLTGINGKYVLQPKREIIYANCDSRFSTMLEQGAVEEVQTLLERHLDPTLPVMKSLGVPELTAYIRGDLPLEMAMQKACQNTRNFAKRQMTWFRQQNADWCFIETPEGVLG